MTKFIIFIFLAMMGAKACDQNMDSSLDSGTITKLDNRDCACCGGWFINIGKETYRFYDIPEGSDLKISTDKLPMEVELKWEKQQNACMGDEINVLYIKEK